MSDTAKSLSLERKIKMQEAREGIINRLALTLPTTINLDRFLNVIVSELGRMMNVDRCDVIQLTSPSELRISHEWRATDDVPSSLGTAIPLDLRQLSEHVDITKPIRLDDTDDVGLILLGSDALEWTVLPTAPGSTGLAALSGALCEPAALLCRLATETGCAAAPRHIARRDTSEAWRTGLTR